MIYMHTFILWHINMLLHNGCETTDETMATARQQLPKYTAVLEPLLGSGSCTAVEVLFEALSSENRSLSTGSQFH
jgi:hypothetical protein